jgi:hypothetical protein
MKEEEEPMEEGDTNENSVSSDTQVNNYKSNITSLAIFHGESMKRTGTYHKLDCYLISASS